MNRINQGYINHVVDANRPAPGDGVKLLIVWDLISKLRNTDKDAVGWFRVVLNETEHCCQQVC